MSRVSSQVTASAPTSRAVGPGLIEVRGLTKRFGPVVAVDELSFTVEPGSITGFLGPNGAGKTTTLRMLLGLVRPDGGSATIGGTAYAQLDNPSEVVGSALEATGFHPARSGRDHLRVYCTVNGYPLDRADEVLERVGLAETKRRRVGGFSLGMRQRLALAAALLGDPRVLILDEPANGLDPDGVLWLRHLLRELADTGRTVLVSSHVLTEMQQLVDRVVIVSRGQLVRQGSLAELTAGKAPVLVRTPDAQRLIDAVEGSDARARAGVEHVGSDVLHVRGMAAADIGRLAMAAQVELHELTPGHGDLEGLFFSLTSAHGDEGGA